MTSSKPAEHNNIPSCFTDTHGLITATTTTYKTIETVSVLTVRTRSWDAGLGAIVRPTVGGEMRPFMTRMYRAHNEAVERLVGECMGRRNAAVAMRFDIASFEACVHVCAYETVCRVERDGEREGEDDAARGGGDEDIQPVV
ncbi:uncharacterized protein APUU_31402A [Aspergillus puulaauensis]|uniref:Uncharacterized protein n=1 Tax=Aspergillus puulaauensis TaxID=1220207 RepID=A0A7R7XL30_9EURO|nr:uncharacterized protein APUU_31402A [Aspergillus puulaauensis]BCS23177.1 hypothetical protein APUU_31402A [Aspergillus puulaauensis]